MKLTHLKHNCYALASANTSTKKVKMKKNAIRKHKPLSLLLALSLLMLPLAAIVLSRSVSGATLTDTYIRLNRLKAGQTTSFRLVFTTVGSGATSVAIDFNGADSSTWTGSSGAVNATQTVSSASCASETGATALPGSITASGSGSTVTISSVTALSATTAYCVDLTSSSAVTNATAGEYHPTVTVGSDSTTVAVRTISEDQIQVTATVPPSFNFAFNNTTADAFGNLDTGSVSNTTGKTITLTTNATSGWILWVKDLNSGLKSSTAGNYTIDSTTAGSSCASGHGLSAGTEGYGLDATITTDATGGGTVSLDNNYNCGANAAGGLDTTYRTVASADGTADGDVITVQELAAIAGSTPAANDYTDTLTFIGAGNF